MKTILFATALAALASPTALLGAEAPVHPADPSKTPEGLSDTDWSGIRGAYERQRHAVVANPDGTHQARNPGQAWLTKFDGRGFTVTPDSGGWSWGLELAGYGEVTEVREDGGKISYVRGDGLTEWFVNDGRGLEQGWTLARRPVHAGMAGPIRLHLAVRGNLHPQVSGEGASVAFMSEAGSAALTYGGLKAWDADGKVVQARFAEGEIRGNELCVEVDDVDARYPITIDPIAQQAYLKASNTAADDSFGESVAISGDTVVIGASTEDSSATGVNGNQGDNSAQSSGAAYVFVRSGSTWSQQAYLKASNTGAGDSFGCSVAVSGDTVVVGAPHESSSATGVNGNQTNNSAQYSGAAYVFVRTGTVWSQQAYLKASNTGADVFFGTSAAVSGDTVVVGAWREGNTASGAAYVFVRDGTTWSQQSYLKASNAGTSDAFGYSVAVSGDTVVVGAYLEASNATGVNGNQWNDLNESSGAAYVFVRSGSTWSQQAYLKAFNNGAGGWLGGWFGYSVAISGDTVVVGAINEQSSATGVDGNQTDNPLQSSGAAYVFVRNGTTWNRQAYLKASNTGFQDLFGISVAVSGDTVVIGAEREDSGATGTNGNQADNSVEDSGAAYMFVRTGTTWSQHGYIKASNTRAGDCYFGNSVAVSGDTIVVGGQMESSNADGVNGNQADNSATNAGAAYVFIVPYSLLVSTVHGFVQGTGDYRVGTVASLTATPNPGYLFTGWSGDATSTANPLSVLMDSDKTITANFTPDTNDTDEDGLTNYQEIVEYGTDPTKQDTDNDGVKDSTDALPLDPTETLDSDHDGIGDNTETDDDNDGLSDVDEINTHHTNPKLADSDGDGLSDPDELQVHTTNPNIADTDNDGLNDGEEFLTHHTNPKVNDTDADGFLDGYEVLTGKSPLDIADHPALVAEARTAIEFTFPAALGKTYRIEDSPDLATWTTVESGIAGTGQLIQRFYTTRGMPMRYFRVEEDGP
jgi:uncharacterized repeat protein (TIGR02543 family)